ncbi:MAG: LytR/AlgR family response regulator transcription factor [Rufibacter sp.]
MLPNKINCLVLEDEKPAQQIMMLHIQRLSFLSLRAVASSATQALNHLRTENIDLLFADINLPGISGLQLAQSLPPTTGVIFTTAYEQFAIKGFELNAVDYLVKPIGYERFEKAVNRYLQHFHKQPAIAEGATQTAQRPFLFIRCERKMTKLYLDEILYIEAQRNYLLIQTSEGVHKTYQSISELEEKLPAGHFLRVHRSFIVSVDQVTALTVSQIIIQQYVVPIGRLYRKAVMSAIGQLKKDSI